LVLSRYHSALFFIFYTSLPLCLSFFFNAPATTAIYTLSLHDALPISLATTTPRARAHSTTLRRCSTPSTRPVGLDGEFSHHSRTRPGPTAVVASAGTGSAPARRAPTS